MTLIVSVLTPTYIILASDRRLTRSNGELHDEEACKHVWSYGNLMIGYTGAAYIGSKPTDLWVIETLQGVEPNNQVRHLANAATLAQHELTARFGRPQPLEFMVSYFGENKRRRYVPGVSRISNFRNHVGTITAPSTTMAVSTHVPSGVEVVTTGAPVDISSLRVFKRFVANHYRRNSADVDSVVWAVVEAMHSISQQNVTVGPDFLVTVFPLAARGKTFVSTSMRREPDNLFIDMDVVNSLFFPAPGSPNIFYGPSQVTEFMLFHGSMMTNDPTLSEPGQPFAPPQPPPGFEDSR